MSKVKNYYWDLAEKTVDAILLELKNNAITIYLIISINFKM